MICCALPMCLICIAVGVGVAAAGVGQLVEARRVGRWPRTTATILSAVRQKCEGSDTDSVEVVVRYAYTVGGEDFEGGRIHPTYGGSNLFQTHDDLMAVLRAGATVSVYHRPDSPAESYLTAGFLSGPQAVVAIGCGFAAMGAGLLLGALGAGPHDGEGWPIEDPIGHVGVAVAGIGFGLSWAFAMWCFIRGDWDYAGRVEAVEPAPAAEEGL